MRVRRLEDLLTIPKHDTSGTATELARNGQGQLVFHEGRFGAATMAVPDVFWDIGP